MSTSSPQISAPIKIAKQRRTGFKVGEAYDIIRRACCF